MIANLLSEGIYSQPTLSNWVRLQDEYECYYFVADWHALTSNYADSSNTAEFCYDTLLDWLSVGLDPEKCSIFVQVATLLYGCIVPWTCVLGLTAKILYRSLGSRYDEFDGRTYNGYSNSPYIRGYNVCGVL